MTQLTTSQLAALKADLAARLPSFPPEWKAEEIAAWYNQPGTPDFVVWRTRVTSKEWRQAIIGGGGATQLDALTASKRDALFWACQDDLDPSKANIRTALDDFCGSQNTLKTAIQAVQKRGATRAEKLLATGTGSNASPGTMSFEGKLTYVDIESAQEYEA